jgi:hypothetical protein
MSSNKWLCRLNNKLAECLFLCSCLTVAQYEDIDHCYRPVHIRNSWWDINHHCSEYWISCIVSIYSMNEHFCIVFCINNIWIKTIANMRILLVILIHVRIFNVHGKLVDSNWHSSSPTILNNNRCIETTM